MRPQSVLAALAPFLICGGCHFFVPDTRTPADRAREVAPRCQGFTDESAATLLSPAAIDSVEPAYSYLQSGPGDRVILRAPGSTEQLHILEVRYERIPVAAFTEPPGAEAAQG